MRGPLYEVLLLLRLSAAVPTQCLLPFLSVLSTLLLLLLPLSLHPSDGIDWLVESAGLRALRLILVLTNGGSNAGGGMQQYTHWVDPALTVVDFYGNDTVKVSGVIYSSIYPFT